MHRPIILCGDDEFLSPRWFVGLFLDDPAQ